MKKPLSLLLCLLTLLSCIGCESLVSNGNGTTEPTEITTAKQGENPFGEVLERLKENVSFSTRKDETRLYLLSDGEKTTLVEMLKGIVFLKIEKTEYKDKTSVAPRDKTQWIEIIFGNTEEESETCVLTVFSDGMIYATHSASDTEEYFVSAEVAVVYYSFNAYIAGLLVSDGYTDNRTEKATEAPVTTSENAIQQPLPPFDELLVRNNDGTVLIYKLMEACLANDIQYNPFSWGPLYGISDFEKKEKIIDVFRNIKFTEKAEVPDIKVQAFCYTAFFRIEENVRYSLLTLIMYEDGSMRVSTMIKSGSDYLNYYFVTEAGSVDYDEYTRIMDSFVFDSFVFDS